MVKGAWQSDWQQVADEMAALRERLAEAEIALLNAAMGVMEPVARYMRKYPQPVQPGDKQ